MSPYELLDLGIAAGTRIDVQWGLFVTVHLAILGGITYVERPLRAPEKAGATAVYLAFAVVSYRATRFHMSLLQNAYKDVAEVAVSYRITDLHIVQFLAEDMLSGRFQFANHFAAIAHIAMATLVIFALLFDVELTARLKQNDGNARSS